MNTPSNAVPESAVDWQGIAPAALSQALVLQARGSVPVDPLTSLTPGRFLSTPGLCIGLASAAAFLAAAVRLRRYREPI